MKKRIQLLLGATLIVFMGLGQAFGQTIIAADSAGNYSSWSNGDDQGYGFTSWTLETITNGGSAGHFIGSSSAQGFGDINTSSKAFGMYGNPNPGSGQNQANADMLMKLDLNYLLMAEDTYWKDKSSSLI